MEPESKETLSDLDVVGEKAQRALRERPNLSIRTRLTTRLVFWFIITVGLSIASILTLSRIQDKLLFTEAVDQYTFEVQQARRFEKNYFLYRTNLVDALEHLHNAQSILDREKDKISVVIGETGLLTMSAHLQRYEGLLERLQTLDQEDDPGASPEYREIETGLRDNGAEMVAEAEDLVDQERTLVNAMLLTSKQYSIAFVVVLLLLIAFVVFFVAREMLAPLNRMLGVAERIAKGDFTPIMPKRKYFDEFSQLAVAMNHMMIQLTHRYDLLVQAHKLQAVGTLTAGVAHELNNPINNIMLTAVSLQEEYEELSHQERQDMVGDLVGESERAGKIVRNLLDFARESSLESFAIRPQHLVEETLQLATNQIKLAKVKVKGEIEDNLPAIYGDFQQLTQVFLNIVLNALDAMPDGGTLNISISSPRGQDQVIFEFTDSGIGMPEHILANIFDPFFTTKSGVKGTGLGLSVSLGIVQQHGGDIHVTSEAGTGTTFRVLIPVAKVPASISGELEGDEDEFLI